MSKNKMMQWIGKALETDKFSIKDHGSSEKGDGYIGEVNFVKVIVNDPNIKEKELSLVVKVSKSDPIMRTVSLILCTAEVNFYGEVFPILDKFQQEKNVKQSFNAVPKCYKSFIEDDKEIIVMENIKIKGYVMYYNIQPLNMNHIKLTLKNYAKFHAISFALLDQRKDLFKQIERKYKYSLVDIVNCLKPIYDKLNDKVENFLIEAGRKDLAQKLGMLMEKGCYNNVKNSLQVIPEERIAIHGDCHSQNHMFKYQDGDKENPLAVAFVDFNMSAIHSPMVDLAYFWYFGAPYKGLPHFQELMEFYYKEVSSSVTDLGSDLNKMFPISKMWEHWEKYSMFGFCMGLCNLDLFYSEDVIDFLDIIDETKDTVNTRLIGKKRSAYLERIVAITDHYFNFKIN